MYIEDEFSYLTLVLVPRDNFLWMLLSEINGKRSVSLSMLVLLMKGKRTLQQQLKHIILEPQ